MGETHGRKSRGRSGDGFKHIDRVVTDNSQILHGPAGDLKLSKLT